MVFPGLTHFEMVFIRAFGLALNPVMLQRPLPLLGIGGVVVRTHPSSSFALSLQVLEGP